MKPRPFLAAMLVAACSLVPFVEATATYALETPDSKAEVPALFAYHEVIKVIWHEAWPAKDTARLRELLPQVESGAQAIVEAKLPGILREKQAAWDDGVKRLQGVVAAYSSAVAGRDDKALLDAAENLHAQYEAMIRILRPPLPELETFHQALYRLYHADMPSGDAAAMRATIETMKEPMAKLQAAPLPASWSEEKADRFRNARTKLGASYDALAKAAPKANAAKLKTLIEEMHDRYLGAVSVCE